jgi:MoxR-like ATPase
MAQAPSLIERLQQNVGRALIGKAEVVQLAVIGLIARGHLLIEDVPGVGKTTLAAALARSIGAGFQRIQFTSDMLPADVLGVTVWEPQRAEFVFKPGPLFTNVVLADEINRTTPKTQSSLLEAMNESQVSLDHTTYPLPRPFMVLATQNPREYEGTYPLPESQLDRFLMRVSVGYPSPNAELEILDAHGDHDPFRDIGPVVGSEDVKRLAQATRQVHVAPSLKAYLVDVAQATRRSSHLSLGVSPRATLALQRVAKARAAAEGRSYVLPDDVKALAVPVLAHRLIVTPEAQLQGISPADALAEVLRAVPVPAAH